VTRYLTISPKLSTFQGKLFCVLSAKLHNGDLGVEKDRLRGNIWSWPVVMQRGRGTLLLISGRFGACQRLSVVPRHPLRRPGFQFPCVALQFGQIVERVGGA